MSAVSEIPKAEPAQKEERIDLRTNRRTKALLQKASELEGVTLSAFIVSNSSRAAKQVVDDHDVLVLSNRDRDKFLRLVENPPKPNAVLKRYVKKRRG